MAQGRSTKFLGFGGLCLAASERRGREGDGALRRKALHPSVQRVEAHLGGRACLGPDGARWGQGSGVRGQGAGCRVRV